jgi:hypothetical protein
MRFVLSASARCFPWSTPGFRGKQGGRASSRAANRSLSSQYSNARSGLYVASRTTDREDAIPPSDGSNSRRATVDLEVPPMRILRETDEHIFRSMVEKELVRRTRQQEWRG